MSAPDPDPPSRRRDAGPGPSVERGPSPLTAGEPGEERILTVPNLITLLRLACLPVFLWVLFGLENRVAAAILLGTLGATDWVDGWIARRFHQTSRLGKLFDPTADRILFFVALTAILVDGSVARWFLIVVLAREAIVAGITVTLLVLGNPPVDVTWWGKAGTFALMVAIPLLLAAGDPGFGAAGALTVVGWLVAIPGLVFSFVAWIRYVPLWQEAWREGRILRAQRSSADADGSRPTTAG